MKFPPAGLWRTHIDSPSTKVKQALRLVVPATQWYPKRLRFLLFPWLSAFWSWLASWSCSNGDCMVLHSHPVGKEKSFPLPSQKNKERLSWNTAADTHLRGLIGFTGPFTIQSLSRGGITLKPINPIPKTWRCGQLPKAHGCGVAGEGDSRESWAKLWSS
jgi:hypothetical protein